jgi:hypothetical protein
VLLSAALALLVAPSTTAAMAAAPQQDAGLASGFNSTVSRLGSLIAVAVSGLVVALVYGDRAGHGTPLAVGQEDPLQRAASVAGFRAAMLVAAAFALVGAATAALGVATGRPAAADR